VVIVCIVGDNKLGFIKDSRRILVACSRARDSLVILSNFTGLRSENSRTRQTLDRLQGLFAARACYYSSYSGDSERLAILETDKNWHKEGGQAADACGGEEQLPINDSAIQDDWPTAEASNGEGITAEASRGNRPFTEVPQQK